MNGNIDPAVLRRNNPRDNPFPIDAQVLGRNRKGINDTKKDESLTLTPLTGENSCVDELYGKLKAKDKTFVKRWENYVGNKKVAFDVKKKKLEAKTELINKVETEIFDEANLERYIKCKKFKELLGDTWNLDVEHPKLKTFYDEKKKCNGYPETYEERTDDYKNLLNSQETEFSVYQQSKKDYFKSLKQAKVVLNPPTYEIIESKGLALDAVLGESEQNKAYMDELNRLLKDTDPKYFNQYVSNLEGIEKQFFDRSIESKLLKIKKHNDELDSVFSSANSSLDVNGFSTGDIFDDAGDVLRRTGDAVGGVLDAAGNIVVSALTPVLTLVDNSIRETAQFTEKHIEKFGSWVSHNPGEDINQAVLVNIFLKPLNWLACGGKQPPDKEEDRSEEDGCIEAGLECTKTADGTDCRLTDSQGNPSETPQGSDEHITDEQLRWMHQVEQQDMISSMDFSESLVAWMGNRAEAKVMQKILKSRQAELSDKIKKGTATKEETQKYISLIKLIKAAANGAADGVVDSIISLFNVVETVEGVSTLLNTILEKGAGEVAGKMGDALAAYWAEYQSADPERKAEIIGRVSADIAMSLVPVGAAAKLGKTLIKTAANSGKLNKYSAVFAKSASKFLDKSKTSLKDFNLSVEKIYRNQIGAAGGIDNFVESAVNYAKKMKFTDVTTSRMNNSARHVPVNTLAAAVKYGKRAPDPGGAAGAYKYTTQMYRNGKKYNLEVVVRESDNTVLHFHYEGIK